MKVKERARPAERLSISAAALPYQSAFGNEFATEALPGALETSVLQPDYYLCWQELKKNFDPDRP
ncbi:MAG: hypothetical protein A3H35_12695 [Betaproteobacteria bacterium RIFCSPLOWO2_02_FULL_62_17]|nr:MAG: hypothetical protein A3H35_12695 [Betaproteobacteria bacterium RIFCSPLOWO2_02_FULL_62_17]